MTWLPEQLLPTRASSVTTWAATTSYTTGQLITRLGMIFRVTADFTSGASFSLANLAMVSAPMIGTFLTSGMYSFPGGGIAVGTTSNTLGNNTMRASAVYLPQDVTLIRLGGDIATVGEAGSKLRLGIYGDTGSYAPGALLVDAGQINGDSATVQELTINLFLAAGIYWFAGAVQSAPTTQPTVRTYAPATPAPLTAGAPTAAAGTAGWIDGTSVTGALPATFTLGSTAGNVPRPHFKAA